MISGLEGLLEIVDLEVIAENVRAVTNLENLRVRVPDSRSCDTTAPN